MISATVLGNTLAYALVVLLVNRMSATGFEAYTYAASAFLLVVKLAPLGAEKLGLRVIPTALAGADHAALSGYLRYALWRSGIGTIVASAIMAAWLLTQNPSTELIAAIIVGAVAVPLGVVAQLGLDALTAFGRPVAAALAVRTAVPAIAIATVVITGSRISAATAVGAWAFGWGCSVIIQIRLLARAIPAAVWTTKPQMDRSAWNALSQQLWLVRAASGLIAQSAVIMLVWSDVPAAEVAGYVAATVTTGLFVAALTSANRVYSSEMSRLLDRNDSLAIATLIKKRFRRLFPLMGVIVMLVMSSPELVLSPFPTEVAQAGVMPLRILCITASVAILFALFPIYLTYRGQGQAVSLNLILAASANIMLLRTLVPSFGATGAAVSTAIASLLLYVCYAVLTFRK